MLALGLQAVMLLNGIEHVGASVLFGGYTPGAVTGGLLMVPFSVYLLWRALREGQITWPRLVLAIAVSLILVAAVAFGSLYIGGVISQSLVR